MAESAAFDCLCEFLEAETSFDRLEARGTVRIALKKAGLTPRDVDSRQLALVIDKLLASELETRGIEDAAQICKRASIAVDSVKAEARANSPTSVFERMVGE